MILLSLFFLFPVVWMIANSFKPDAEITADMNSVQAFIPPMPSGNFIDNYISVITDTNFLIYMGNTLLYATILIVLGIIVNGLAGYALSMTGEECEAATRKAVGIAKRNGVIISFDPNLRENLWDSLDRAREKIEYGIANCDILKISDNEIQWFTGEQNFDRAVEKLQSRYSNIMLLLLSLGKNGSLAYSGENSTYAPAAPANTIDTTGAGDTFCGAILSKVLEHGLRDYSQQELSDMLIYANAAAAIVTERRGALKVMPQPEEIMDRMRRSNND